MGNLLFQPSEKIALAQKKARMAAAALAKFAAGRVSRLWNILLSN